MDLALLRTFVAVHRAGSFTRAARLLGLSQPAVTGQIRALERQLGRPLFLRLVAVLHAVLETNVPVAEVLAFKRALAERVEHSGAALEQSLGLQGGDGVRLLLWLQAVVPGLAQMAAPPAPLHAALRSDVALSGFLIDFTTELQALLATVVRGMQGATESSS